MQEDESGGSSTMIKTKREHERRGKWRFGIERELRYKQLEDDAIVVVGTGKTLDISSTGVAFIGDHNLTPGAFVELSVSWPVLLDDTCPMRLIIFGRVIRNSSHCTACSVDKYEFRTQARVTREAPTPIRNDAMLRRWAETMRTKPAAAALEARASA
jgi:hypothetical protein